MIPLRLSTGPARRAKYGNRKVPASDGGKPFDSAAEARRYGQLVLLQHAGQITELRRQVAYELVPAQRDGAGKAVRAVSYVADFVYLDQTGQTVVEDVKGVTTAEYRLKAKLMLWRHGVEVQEVR